jgi:hypothetical protein
MKWSGNSMGGSSMFFTILKPFSSGIQVVMINSTNSQFSRPSQAANSVFPNKPLTRGTFSEILPCRKILLPSDSLKSLPLI